VKNGNDFIGQYIGQSLEETKKILEEARGGVLLIDEAYMLDAKRNHNCPFRQEVIDTIVGVVQGKPGEDLCVIMCGYNKEMEDFIQQANPGLRRRFPIEDAFVSQEFNEEQLGKIFDLKMSKQNLTTTGQGRAVALRVLEMAKQRPNFGNGGEIDNLLSRAIKNFQLRFRQIAADQRLSYLADGNPLIEADFDPEYSRNLRAEDEVDRQFRDLIGLGAQADEFRALARRVKAMNKRKLDPKPFIPFTFVFKGPPGCGKTTVARKVGRLYHEMGLLATDEVVEASVQDMIADYVGQTVRKTRELIERAMGKVLFIDEAYRLTANDSASAYAAEARDELVDAMTKPHFVGKLVIVLAGYDKEMDIMLSKNPGLSSRFSTQIKFTKLSSDSSVALLRRSVEQSTVKARFNKDEEYIKEMLQSLSFADDWGNGRDIQSISREIVGRAFEDVTEDADPVADEILVVDILKSWHVQRGLPLPEKNTLDEKVSIYPPQFVNSHHMPSSC